MLVFIKTINSPVDTADFIAELEDNGIYCECGGTGVYVDETEFDDAEEILMEMEEECNDLIIVQQRYQW